MPGEKSVTEQCHEIVSRLNNNLSYTKEYHEKYYYPAVAHNRVSAHSDCKLKSCLHARSKYTISSSEQRCSSWYLDPVEGTSGSVLPTDCNHNTGENLEGGLPHMDTKHSTLRENIPSAENVEDWEGVKKVGRLPSESVTSEDSVFSEDYIAMTDAGEDGEVKLSDIGGGRMRRGENGEADSSFSSPFSSSSTLEADGKQDGDFLKDVPKDKVVAGSTGGKNRPNVKLSMPKPLINLDDIPGYEDNDLNSGLADTYTMKASDSVSFYEDREFDFLKTEPIRRSTSLKTYKTPPGTPSRKKGVRFADALGLDLESVRHILNLEDPPVVPKSAMRDLVVGIEEDHKGAGVKYLSALFSQPGADPGFMRRVSEGKIVLENLIVNDTDMTLSGAIRVANVSYHKKVLVRYTCNGWVSSDDIIASYVQNSNDGTTDRFSFTLNVPKYFAVGQRLELCLMYNAGGTNFWDNNFGKNYAIECYARAIPVSESDNTWMHFL